MAMPDLLLTLLLIGAILVLADLVLAGGAMTMTGMSAMTAVIAHPLVVGAAVILVILFVFVLGGKT